MSVQHAHDERPRRNARVAIAALLVVVLAAPLVGWLLLRGDDDEAEPAKQAPARIAATDELRELAESSESPVYWVGPRPGAQYELSRTSNGRIYIRYLPRGVEAGDPRPNYLSVGTYPVENALADARRSARATGAVSRDLPGGGLAVYNRKTPSSVYVAYPGSDRLVEVYHPSPATARQLAYSRALAPIIDKSGSTPRERGEPVAVTAAELRQLAGETDHPVYWLGARPGAKYELTDLPNGQIYIRYLPRGVAVGDHRPRYETVGSYPAEDGVAAVEKEAERIGAVTFDLPGGGKAYYSESAPTNVHFALPGANVEVEVFHPEPGRAEQLVRSGRVVPIR
jgi:hypothetical protein